MNRFISEFESTVKSVSLIQLRLKHIVEEAWDLIVKECLPLAIENNCRLMVNSSISQAINSGVDAVHLDGEQLKKLHDRHKSLSDIVKELQSGDASFTNKAPVQSRPSEFLFSASCHDLQQIQMAQDIGVHFIVLSPVVITHSHPNSTPIGWGKFQSLVKKCNIPVYALGGLSKNDVLLAQENGAQGVAGISSFWHNT